MARRRRLRSAGRTAKRRTAWLESVDAGQEPEGLLTSANIDDVFQMYSFSSAEKYADNFGGGDWIVERMLGSLGISMEAATGARQLLKICFGIGMGMGPTDITLSTDVVDIGVPTLGGNPEMSWMVQVCCYIDTVQLRVERCDFNVKSRRKIGQRSRMWSAFAVRPAPFLGNDVKYSMDFRTLLMGPSA